MFGRDSFAGGFSESCSSNIENDDMGKINKMMVAWNMQMMW